jgi:hypothetical protein
MHPRTRELLAHLETCHAELDAAVAAVPEARRDQAPAAGRWSVANIVEHLALTAGQVASLLSRGLRQLERDGLRPATDDSPVLPTIDAARLLDRQQKVTAPSTVAPRNALACALAMQTLADSRRALADALRAADGIDVSTIRAPHPALGELGFHGWVAFVGLHERRHTAQVRDTAAQLSG